MTDARPPVPGPDIVISVRDLGKKYRLYGSPQDRLKEALHPFKRRYHRDHWALRGVSFDVGRGETMGIIGENGSGKSTLLYLLSGILEPSEGEVVVRGAVSALLELGAGYNRDYTGRENVYMVGAIRGMSKEELDGRFDGIASFADIGDFIDQPVRTYSTGMFLRLAFAVATSIDPDILVIDEALAVGDVFFRQKCFRRLNEFRDRGVPIILVSHAMNEVQQFCRRALLLDKGRAVFEGTAREAVQHYYVIKQAGRAARKAAESDAVPDVEPAEGLNGTGCAEGFWPSEGAFLDLSRISQVSDGAACCTALALCNGRGEPARTLEQGDTARFFYEFEVNRDIEVPVGGIVLYSEKSVIVHGKSSVESALEPIPAVSRGGRVRFEQDIVLDLQPGEYTFDVGFSTMGREDYLGRHRIAPPDLPGKFRRLCHLPNAGSFVVTFRNNRRLHYGLCDLRGDFRVSLSPFREAGDRQETSRAPQAATGGKEQPAVFHVTHWKAGSQWVYRVLKDCVPGLVVNPRVGTAHFLSEPLEKGKVYPTCYVTREQFYGVRLPGDWRRFIVIRDLRDTLVSAYFSFMVSHPNIADTVLQFRQSLKGRSTEEGLLFLMDDWLARCADIQRSWLEAGETFIRYEDLLSRDLEIFDHVLIGECGLPVTKDRLREAVEASRFERLTKGRQRGEEDVTAHERKGVAGDWRNHFTDRVRSAFKERYGPILILTGYERDNAW